MIYMIIGIIIVCLLAVCFESFDNFNNALRILASLIFYGFLLLIFIALSSKIVLIALGLIFLIIFITVFYIDNKNKTN